MTRYLTSLLLAASLLSSPPAFGRQRPASKPAPTIEGTITWPDKSLSGRKLYPDADTPHIELKDGTLVKVRLHFADAPEVSHSPKEIDQPGGKEALEYIRKPWEGKEVIATVRGDESYGRPIVDVVAKDGGEDIAMDLVAHGWAMADPRFHPPKAFVDAEAKARDSKLGLFGIADKTHVAPIAPWDWRKKARSK